MAAVLLRWDTKTSQSIEIPVDKLATFIEGLPKAPLNARKDRYGRWEKLVVFNWIVRADMSKTGELVDIPDGIFAYSEKLQVVDLNPKTRSIGRSAFRGCSGLNSISIPAEVISIKECAFYGCSNLKSINIPSGVTSIGPMAFYDCSSLMSISLPSGITSIDQGTFYDCSSLTSVNIPSGVRSIGPWAFQGCSSLTNIRIPNGVTTIDKLAFAGCSGLASIKIPSGIKSIGPSAFADCSNLKSLSIPSGVTSIGFWVFSGCSLEVLLLGGADLLKLKGLPDAKQLVATWPVDKSKHVTSKGQIVEQIDKADASRLVPALAEQKAPIRVIEPIVPIPVAAPVGIVAKTEKPAEQTIRVAKSKSQKPVPPSIPRTEQVPMGATSRFVRTAGVVKWEEFDQIGTLQKGGQSSEILKMRHKPTGRLVVAKIISTTGVRTERIHHEVEMLQSFSACPQIVPFIGISDLPSRPDVIAIITEFAEGGSLEDALKVDSLSPVQVSQILIDVLLGLQALHDVGVVHRDIKPSNILLNKMRDHAFLCDLGASRLVQPGATQTAVLFTEAYVAEEARIGKAVLASDIFSFGVVLREAVTKGKLEQADAPWLAVRDNKFDARPVDNQLVASLILDCVRRDPPTRPMVEVVLKRFKAIDPSSLMTRIELPSGTRKIRFQEGDDPTLCGFDALESQTVAEAIEEAGLERRRLYHDGLAVANNTRIGKLNPNVIYVLR